MNKVKIKKLQRTNEWITTNFTQREFAICLSDASLAGGSHLQ